MLKLKDKNKKLITGLTNYKDLCIESTLSTGDKKLSFSLHKKDKFYNFIEEECYIETKNQEYVIKARDVGVDYTRFYCILNLEELESNIFDRFESVEQTINNALNLAIVNTGWTVKSNALKKKRTVRCTNKNALEIVQVIKKTYRVDIVFNTLSKQIEIHEHLGEDRGAYFIDSLNLTALQVQSDSYKFATRIIAEGKDGLSFADINGGKNYVENYKYSNKIKTIYWKDERYTVKESLLEDAKAKLREISKPFTSYNASILNLAQLNPKYKNILDYRLGDTITLLSKSNKVKDKQRIVKTIEYPEEHSKDTVELANAILKFEDIQQENQETTDTVSNITVDNGTVDGSTIDSIQVKQIEDFKANVLEVANLKAINANIDNLHANKADIQDLHAVTAKIGTLETTKANITQLNATNAEISNLNAIKADITDLNAAVGKINVLETKAASIDNLVSQKADIKDLNALNANISKALIKKATIAELEALETKTNNLIADKANIKDLNATNANINKIQADTADINTLINGNLSSENIQTGGITSDKLTIANGFITDLMISSVSASKITAGRIDAAKINVVNLNADNLTVGKINGQLLKDGSVSGLAIDNGAIDNSKVAPEANIEASKIDINSVVTAINTGSTLLTANKVAIDSNKGTLDVAFKNLNTSLDTNKKATESNLTAINVVQGKINASIENSKILEGKQKTLEDNYNRTASTVDSLKNTIGSHKTLIDSATGKITSVEIKANTLEKNLSGLTQTVNDTKKVIENNKTVLESKNAELKANIDKVSSDLSSVSNTVDKNNKSLVSKSNKLEQNLSGLTQTVANNKTATDGKITSVENVTHELKAGLGGLTSKLDTLKSTTDGINKTVINQGSAINQLQDSIKLKIDSSTFNKSTETINNSIKKAKEDAVNSAKANTTNAISNLKIGGRNLAQLTEPKEYSSFTGKINDCQMDYEILLDSLNVDDPVTVSYTFSYKNLIPVNNHNDYGIWLQGCGDVTEWNSGGFPGGSRLNPKINWGAGHSGSFKVEYTFKLEANAKKNKKWFTSFRMDYIKSGKVSVKEFMVEYGTKANAYIQAPEDLQSYAEDVAKAKADLAQANAIANADGKITAEERKRIQQAEANLNTAIARADKAKQDAINTASSDATNKANNALNNAKAFVNAEINTVNTHLNKNTSEINILKNKIESKVSQSDINKSIKNINFSDINMILNSANFKDTSNWGITNGSDNLFIENNCLVAKFKNFANWGCYVANYSLRNKPLETSKEYTVVCKLKASRNQTVGFNICDGDSRNCVYARNLNITTEWKIFKFTFKPEQIGNERQFRFITGNLGYEFNLYIGFVKMVEGSTSSDGWTIAPDYVVNKITNITDKISTAESKLTQENDSIKASVQDLKSTTQTITTNISNVNRDLTNKINSNFNASKNFATEIATNKANTAKQEAISSANSHANSKATEALNNAKSYTNAQVNTVNTKVSNVESNLNVLKDKINTKVSQTDIDKSISSITIGGRNLIINSDTLQNLFSPLNGYVGTRSVINDEYALCKKDVVFKCTHAGTGFHLPLFTKNSNRIGKTYTWSFWAKCSVNKRGTIGHESNGQTKVEFTTKWKKFSHTWLFGDCTYSSFTFYTGWNAGEVLYIRDFKIEEGTKATDWTPAPEDTNQLVADNIKVVDSKISNVSSTVAQLKDSVTTQINSINSRTHSIQTTLDGKASKNEVTEVNNRVATVKASLDSITQRVSSTESKTKTLESNINGKASKQEVNNVSSKVVSIEANLNGITNRVSNTESKINSVDGKVKNATTKREFTEFKQNTDKFIWDIQKNGSFIKGNTVTVDRNKLRCQFEDGTYAEMGRDGFEMWKNGMAHPYHCLITQGVINHLSFNSGNYHHRVYLPQEFRGKHFTVQTMIQGWNFPDGHVSGTMASGKQDLDYANGQFTIYFNGGGNYKTNCNIAYVVIA